ncbi:hypothetical protein HNQ08_003023 [Deinococcus humi]|uniref:Uncharacterized protein n=1 Tax=Deinococcus humi TaxID=662880 RepID=A0A7W8NF05_9DEIO|nr:hypothetical protein [Deinococcus humi]
MIQARAARPRSLRWQQWSQLAPLFISQFVTPDHTSFLHCFLGLRTRPREFPVREALGEEVTNVDAPAMDGLAGDGVAPSEQECFDLPGNDGEPLGEQWQRTQ